MQPKQLTVTDSRLRIRRQCYCAVWHWYFCLTRANTPGRTCNLFMLVFVLAVVLFCGTFLWTLIQSLWRIPWNGPKCGLRYTKDFKSYCEMANNSHFNVTAVLSSMICLLLCIIVLLPNICQQLYKLAPLINRLAEKVKTARRVVITQPYHQRSVQIRRAFIQLKKIKVKEN